MQNVLCFRKIDQIRMLLHLDFSTIFIVCFSVVCRIVTIFDLSSCSARWYASSSTLNARCPATGMNESAEEDHPYTSPTRKLSASKSSLGRRHRIEVCPNSHVGSPAQLLSGSVTKRSAGSDETWRRWIGHSRSLLVFRLQRETCFLCPLA